MVYMLNKWQSQQISSNIFWKKTVFNLDNHGYSAISLYSSEQDGKVLAIQSPHIPSIIYSYTRIQCVMGAVIVLHHHLKEFLTHTHEPTRKCNFNTHMCQPSCSSSLQNFPFTIISELLILLCFLLIPLLPSFSN